MRRSAKVWQTCQQLLCGFITIMVLRGTIGAGKFGTPAQDLQEIREHLPSMRLRFSSSHRVLAEAHEEDDRDSMAIPRNSSSWEYEQSYILGPKITDWDAQRARFRSTAHNRVLLVTGSQPNPCDNPVGDHYLLKSLKNKLDYCGMHGIQVFYNMAHLDEPMSGYWSKLPLIRKLMLSHPEVEWIWWMDSDAFFTDMEFTVPLHKYASHNMVLHGWEDQVYDRKNWVGLNTGSFLMRNSQWSLDILDAWAPMGPKGRVREEAGKLLTRELPNRPHFEADDQSALVFLLASQQQRWRSKVFLENSYYLHGYWKILVDKFEDMIDRSRPGFGDDRWPFVTHFVGCKPCGKYGDYPVELCIRQMERAFNFGDNQVLSGLGFRHSSLSSHRVVRREKSQQQHSLEDSLDELKHQQQQQKQHLFQDLLKESELQQQQQFVSGFTGEIEAPVAAAD